MPCYKQTNKVSSIHNLLSCWLFETTDFPSEVKQKDCMNELCWNFIIKSSLKFWQKSLPFAFQKDVGIFLELYQENCSSSFLKKRPSPVLTKQNGSEYRLLTYIIFDKTGVINDPLGQTHSCASGGHCFRLKLFCFEKCTDGRKCKKQWSLPAVTVGRPRGSILNFCLDLYSQLFSKYFTLVLALNIGISLKFSR